MKTEIRPATAADLREFYGATPPQSVKAIAGLLDGRVVAVAGLAYGSDFPTVFSDFKPEALRFKVSIYRGARMLTQMLKGLPAVALSRCSDDGAQRLLERLIPEKLTA